MPDGAPTELRIYCICGQKMKVSAAMFGLPGKCVACRQKIRIPSLDEIPPGTTNVYLKDHPELLRKSRRAPADLDAKPALEEADVALGEPSEPVSVVMLDILEPLRTVCSLEHKIQRQLNALAAEAAETATEDLAVLRGYHERVKAARSDVDEQLRQRLMEVAIDLSNTQEKIVQAGLSARLGEVDYAGYREMTDLLRRRRNYLERMQQNIRAWLSISDPHAAGGYSNVSLDDLPRDGFRIELPPETLDSRSLLDQHMEGLREALVRRDRAEGRFREAELVKAEGGDFGASSVPSVVLADCRADIEAEKNRADAEVSFQRTRLETLASDAADDMQTIQKCLDRLQRRFQAGIIDKGHYLGPFRDLVRAQRDQEKVRGVVARALVANAAAEIPFPKGTFLKRVARPARAPRFAGPAPGLELWLVLASALAMGLAAFMPLVNELSPLEAFRNPAYQGYARWLMLAPVAFGAVAALVSMAPWKKERGVALGVLWLVYTVLFALLVHEAHYGLNPLAVRFRQGGLWLLRPGALLLILANIGLLAALCVSLWPHERLRQFIALFLVLAVVLLVAIRTDLGGYFTAKPLVAVVSDNRLDATLPVYEATISVENTGARTMILTMTPMTARNAFTYGLERQQDTDSWKPAPPPDRIETKGINQVFSKTNPRSTSAAPGTSVIFHYRLEPGEYRVRLVQDADRARTIEKGFTLENPSPRQPEAPAPETATPALIPPTTEPPMGTAPDSPIASTPENSAAPPDPQEANRVEAELRGLITAAGKEPRFSIILHLPEGQKKNLDLTLGDSLYDDWTVDEFNPARQSVTIVNEGRLLVLSRGQRVPLE